VSYSLGASWVFSFQPSVITIAPAATFVLTKPVKDWAETSGTTLRRTLPEALPLTLYRAHNDRLVNNVAPATQARFWPGDVGFI
jgi:hypothetical protein